ncbi:MAG: TonB-dependent receptor [Hyphomonas sp. BRH_c22]|uniref:TonB-dependent receptor domain-containing protein n=1 Tax=Hyphomonas sp. BRH_c22 TaxID=1629710 RepID=UPI0005F0CE1D|nr:TonB-dependent receptor [Hyphomonas sp. BRH_c22]KJS36706.1 MAG: TonB-dependent receptor [Hyphomonas sp. BRH_c22]
MKSHLFCGAGLMALSVLLPAAHAQTSEPALQDVIVVTGSRQQTATELAVTPESGPLQGGDITYLSARTPGGARIANGELSGQMAYRGLFGERLNLRVDGQRFASGGPNLMDPVFHYAPAPLVAALVIDRGVSPVSKGPGLAGGADAVFKRIDYASGDAARFGYDLTIGARSINDSVSAGGVMGAANDTWRFNLLGAYEEGDDTGYGDGTIGGTGFERSVYGLSTGVKTQFGEFGLDLRRQNTGASGNPPFPMDIQYFDTDFARLTYAAQIGGAALEASVHYTDVAHLMDNFSLRPSPGMMAERASLADATTRGADIALAFAQAGGELKIGLDTEESDHDMMITNPNNAGFLVTPYPDITLRRTGLFAEWTGPVGPFQSELGVRIDRNDYEAGEASVGPALPAGPHMLAAAFNAAATDGDDTTGDAVARFWTPAENGLSWRVTLARKQKMPGYIQRYGWLPINASGGLADGNIYVGDLTLDPETAWLAEVGVDYATSRAYVRPTLFVRQVDDYIQGVAYDATPGVADSPVEMIAAMSGDPTPLRWANVDARLYGFDLDAGYDFAGPLRADAVFSYVRGERRDIDDNLYRISPPNLTAGVTWEETDWSATLEMRAVAEQSDVSVTNSEVETPGYVVLNLFGTWDIGTGVRVAAGVENLLDQVYRDHLSGYNRNADSDVALGTRVPGAGRGAFVRLSLTH